MFIFGGFKLFIFSMESDESPSTSAGKLPKGEKKLPARAQPLHQFQFAEMNLKHTGNPDKTLTLVKRAIRMGYDAVVINVDVGDPFQKVENLELVGLG